MRSIICVFCLSLLANNSFSVLVIFVVVQKDYCVAFVKSTVVEYLMKGVVLIIITLFRSTHCSVSTTLASAGSFSCLLT